MTRYQKGLLRKIFKTDCKLRGRYIDGRHTCAIGALIIASTKRGHELRQVLKENNTDSITALADVARHIRKFFGISLGQQERIQEANDSVVGRTQKKIKIRRNKVLAVVDEFSTK